MAIKFRKGQLLYYSIEGKKMLLYPIADVMDGFTSIPYRCLVSTISLIEGARMDFSEGYILAKDSNPGGLDDIGRYYVLTPPAKAHIEAIFSEWKGRSRRKAIEELLSNLERVTEVSEEDRRKIELVAHKYLV
jgi:hypothetical protein